MKSKCPLSGVTFEVPGFDGLFTKGQHPIFTAPLNKTIGRILPIFAAGKLEPQELHLFGCYLLRHLPIDRWEAPLLELASLSYWEVLWNKNIQHLAAMALRIEGKTIKKLPTFSLLHDSHSGHRPLSNLNGWIADLDLAIREYYAPISDEAKRRNKSFRAELGKEQYVTMEDCVKLIEKALRGSILNSREQQKFPEVIANWAAKVGEFPLAKFTKQDGEKVTIAQYWKEIIIATFETAPGTLGVARLLSEGVSIEDMDELLEHCMINIPAGTMQSRALFMELEKVKEVIQEFRPGSSGKAVSPNFSISVLSDADILSAIHDVSPVAPAKPVVDADPLAPKKENYPTLTAFIQAKKRYADLKKQEAQE